MCMEQKLNKHMISLHDVAPGSDKTPCNKIDKPLMVYRFGGNLMTSIITRLKIRENPKVVTKNATSQFFIVM